MSHLRLSLSNLWRETDVVNDKLSKETLKWFSFIICQGSMSPWLHLEAFLTMQIIDSNGLWPQNGPGWDVVSCSERCANYSRYINVSFCSPPYHHLISAHHPMLSDTQLSKGNGSTLGIRGSEEGICSVILNFGVWFEKINLTTMINF